MINVHWCISVHNLYASVSQSPRNCSLLVFCPADCLIAGEEPFLLFANRHDLRELRLYSGNYHLLVDGQKSIIALDYDFSEKLLFWSDVATERISM